MEKTSLKMRVRMKIHQGTKGASKYQREGRSIPEEGRKKYHTLKPQQLRKMDQQ